MRWYLGIALLGLLAYALFLAASFPAAVALPRLIPADSGIRVGELEGSVWNGVARDLVVPPQQAVLSRVDWDMAWLRLLSGEAVLDVDVRSDGLEARGEAAWALFGRELRIADLEAAFEAGLLYTFGAVPFILRGEIQGRVERLLWSPGGLPRIQGTLTWSDAALELPALLDLGRVEVRATADEDGSRITWEGEPGAVDTQGTLDLQAPAEYALDMILTPVTEPDPGLQSVLRLLGPPRPDGSYRASYAGRLAPAAPAGG